MIINDPKDIRKLLDESRNIAVVGMSPNTERDSNKVGKYLIDKGYNVIPVNPTVNKIYGRMSYPSILDIPKSIKIDIVDVFRNPEASKEVVKEAVKLSPKAVWLQLGAESKEVIDIAIKLDLNIVYGICIMETHKKISNGDLSFVVPSLGN
ncbi:MAG: CoA-binding protein [Thermoplasmatales archaeon]